MTTSVLPNADSHGNVGEEPFEIFSLIWLDDNVNIEGTRNAEQQLRSIINNLRKFQDVKQCQTYIEESLPNDRFVLVVSGQLGRKIVPDIYQLRRVTSIYVYCWNTKAHKEWTQNYSKVQAVIDDLDTLIARIREDQKIEEKVQEPLPIDVFTTGGGPGESTVGLNGRFVFSQVLIDCLLRLKYNETDKTELIDCCQKEYDGNHDELDNLRDFQNKYTPKLVLWWYTKETFFYRTLNAALRKQNIHMIFLLRKYIADIHAQLQELQSKEIVKVYRGQMMTSKELDTLKRSIGQLISINSFFSTSKDLSKALSFFKPSRASEDLERVLFEIRADPNMVTTKSFADISKQSYFKGEAEVLFMIGSIFRLESISRMDDQVWVIRTTLSSDEESNLKPVLTYMKGQFESEEPNLRMLGQVLWKMGQFPLAEKYFMRLLKGLQPHDPLNQVLYKDLGDLAASQQKLDESVAWHQKALKLKNSNEPNDKNSLEPLKNPSNSKTASHGATPPVSHGSQPVAASSVLPAKLVDDDMELFKYVENIMQQDLTILRPIVNLIRKLDQPNTLRTLLATCANERVVVIIPLDQAQAVLAELHQHTCVHRIYLLSDQSRSPSWINGHDQVVGIYRNIDSIRDHLLTVLLPELSRVIPTEITAEDATTNIPFTYCQLLKETMLCEDEESDLKKDMLAFCRTHYADNAAVLREIDEFGNTFADGDSIGWYTRSCFLTKILSRAFRTQEVDLLFKMRHLIQCLHKQIRSLAFKELITCYTVLNVEGDTIQKFREHVKGLVLFRSFVPATTQRPKAKTRQCVVFSLRVEAGTTANINKLRSSDYPFDVLINLDTVFRVVSIDEDGHGGHTVNLQSVSHEDSHFRQLTGLMRKETKVNVVILQLTRLLLRTDHYLENDHLLEAIHQDRSFENDGTLLVSLAASHHLMGNVNEAMRDFEGARRHFFKSIRAFLLCLSYNNARLSASYNNIGSMYYREDYYEQAIKCHQMALQCQLKANNPDMDAVATYASNIGAVYIDQKNYTEAVKHLKRAVVVREKASSSENTKPLISLLQRISKCLWKMDRAAEALEYYKKTLSHQLKLPNPADQPLSVTYFNLSTAYEKVGDLDNALECAEKSVACLKRISPDHPELKENQAQLESVRKKQWLKQVLAD